jgi:branched-subunit amino acid transport protein
MINRTPLFQAILLMSIVTLAVRTAPVTAIGGRRIPFILERSLQFIPPAILATVLCSQVMTPHGQLIFSSSNLMMWVTLLSFFIAWKTKSLFMTVSFGVIIVAALRFIFPEI